MVRRGLIIRGLLRDRRVRRVEIAFAGFTMAEYGVWVAVLVYAYRHGGVNVTAAVAVAQLVPAGALAPVLARSVDAWGPATALRLSYWLQSASLALTASLLFLTASPLLIYAAAMLAACTVTMTRPAQAALVPHLVADGRALTAMNVLSGWVEGVSVLAGPALAGVLMAVGGPRSAVAAFVVVTAASGVAASGGGLGELPGACAEAGAAASPDSALRAVRGHQGFTELIVLLGAQYLVIGMLDVLLVVFAISVLGLGAPGAGYLTAAFGAGGVLGSLAALWLVGHHRLLRPFLAAAAGWSALLIVLGAWPSVLGAFLLLAAAGSARTLLDVSGRTILMGAAPAAMRGRVFGALEGVAMLALALGSMLVPLLVALGGARTALIVTGALLSVIALVVALHLRTGGNVGAVVIRAPRGRELTRPA